MMIKAQTKFKIFKPAILATSIVIIFACAFGFSRAEQTGTSGESGVTSYLKTTYNSVVALSYGSDSAGPWGDWGAYWNRIRSAAEWVPSSNAAVTDVRSGKTFYTSSRSQQTGTYPAVSSCSTQQYYASHASASKANNCGLDWTVASPAVTGDDKQDPRTGLVWSKAVNNNSGTVNFIDSASATTSIFSWDASGANNVAVGNKTATQLCSERGNGWRLPTAREGMQSHVDGGYWALTSPAVIYWMLTEGTATTAYYVRFDTGTTTTATRTTTSGSYVRCVR